MQYHRSDASDYGTGGLLFQIAPGELNSDEKQLIRPIKYVSEAFTGTMIFRPTFYKEAKGFVNLTA